MREQKNINKITKTMFDLSIIIVEYHSVDEVAACVTSIRKRIDTSCEIIVSSNSGYSSEEQERISSAHEGIVWLFNHHNGGFAYAMNEGLKIAKGRYLAIMNSDCIITSGLSEMIHFMEQHPTVGAVGPKMIDRDGNIQDTARSYVSLPCYIKRQIVRLTKHKTCILDKMDYNKIQTVDWIIGAFIMVSRTAYEKTNGLDPNFFMYAEDLDWCTRIRQHHLEVVYFPDAIIVYKGTRRARKNMKYAKIFIKSHCLFWRKFGYFTGYPKRRHIVFTSCDA